VTTELSGRPHRHGVNAIGELKTQVDAGNCARWRYRMGPRDFHAERATFVEAAFPGYSLDVLECCMAAGRHPAPSSALNAAMLRALNAGRVKSTSTRPALAPSPPLRTS